MPKASRYWRPGVPLLSGKQTVVMLVRCMPCCLGIVGALARTVCIALQVYFVCADGSLFVLCPVAPFQAAVPRSAVDQLVDISRCAMDESSHSTTQAWLDQVTSVRPCFLPSIISGYISPALVFEHAYYCIWTLL